MILVREPSDVANINPSDDYRINYYAVGGQDGYNADYGTGFSYETNGNIFRLLSGELYLYGVQARVESSGESITIDSYSSTRYFSVYCEIDLTDDSAPTSTIKSTYGSSSYPTITTGDNLIEESNGTARIELYRFTALNGVISNVSKKITALSLTKELIAGVNYNIEEINDNIEEINDDITTINARLDSLGFRQGNITNSSGSVVGKVTVQGNYAFIDITNYVALSSSGSATSIYLPSGFYPPSVVTLFTYFGGYGGQFWATISTNGTITFTSTLTEKITEINIGAKYYYSLV